MSVTESSLAPPAAAIVHKRLRSWDGTEIAYQVCGPPDAPAVVFANGLGGTYEVFRGLFPALGPRRRALCWDYRGLFRSGRPRDLSTLAIPCHCRDLEALLAAERVERAVLVGWSMGVQVNFELYRTRSELVRGIVALNGVAGRPFATALPSRAARALIPAAIDAMQRFAPLLNHGARAVADWNGLLLALQRFGLVGPMVDGEGLLAVVRGFLSLDLALYAELLRRLGEHDAADVLGMVRVPTLIVAGERDHFTPVETAESIHRAVVGSRLLRIPGGTHYVALEYPALLRAELARFLEEVDGGRAPAG